MYNYSVDLCRRLIDKQIYFQRFDIIGLTGRMERKNKKQKIPCKHKLARASLNRINSLPRYSAQPFKTPQKCKRNHLLKELETENVKLRAQNNIYQQYFATFDLRYKEQKRENQKLKREVEQLSKEKEMYSLQKKNDTNFNTSEKTLNYKLSRITKSSRGTIPSDYP